MVQNAGAVPFVTLSATVIILVTGLPHGMFDYLTLRRMSGSSLIKLTGWIAAYCGIAAFALAGWKIFPLASLAVFLVVAVVHFAEDWSHNRP
ncbi:MAG: Brp/Blh family beta-carotene 15,15'-dioxygenase, partial [Pseudomonadota bacterium]